MSPNNIAVSTIFKLYKQAVKKMPFLKFSWVIVAAVCLMALGKCFELNNWHVLLYAVGVIVVSFFAFCFSFIPKDKTGNQRTIAYIAVSPFIFLLYLSVISFASFVFFNKPEFFKLWFPKNQTNDLAEKSKIEKTASTSKPDSADFSKHIVEQHHSGSGDNVGGNKVVKFK